MNDEQIAATIRSADVTRLTLEDVEPKGVRKRLALHCADVLTLADAITTLKAELLEVRADLARTREAYVAARMELAGSAAHAASVAADCARGLQRCHECPDVACGDNLAGRR